MNVADDEKRDDLLVKWSKFVALFRVVIILVMDSLAAERKSHGAKGKNDP